MGNKQSSYPDFHSMTNCEAQEYILKYITTRFSLNGRLVAKLPVDLREDAVQSIYIDLYEVRLKYDPQQAMFSTFAYYRGMGVITKFLVELKRRKSTPLPEIIPDTKQEFIKNKIYRDQINNLISTLNYNEKRIFVMRYLRQWKMKKIAKKTGISFNGVKKALLKIKKRLD